VAKKGTYKAVVYVKQKDQLFGKVLTKSLTF